MAFKKIGPNPHGYKLGKKNEYKAPGGSTPQSMKRDADRLQQVNERTKAKALNFHNKPDDNYTTQPTTWKGSVTKVEVTKKGKL